MLTFASYPTYFRYRTLKLVDPIMYGQDVYALQTALKACGFDPQGCDGAFGKNTDKAVRAFQTNKKLVVDGLAGGGTQKKLASTLAAKSAKKYSLPKGLMYGQTEHESSFRLGNYSVQYPDGSYDAGVVQRNTNYTPPNEGFNVPDSLDVLAEHTRKHYDMYTTVSDEYRRWGLAAGAWNAPAFANYLAGVKPYAVPSNASKQKLEDYIKSVTAYLVV